MTDTMVNASNTAQPDGPATTVVEDVKPMPDEMSEAIAREFDRSVDMPLGTMPIDSWDDPEPAEETTEEPAEKPSEESAKDTVEEPVEEPAEDTDDGEMSLADKAAAWDKVVDAWSRDPAGTLQKYLSGMSEGDRARLLGEIGIKTEVPDTIEFPEEAETPFEEVLLKRKDWVLRGEERVKEMLNEQAEAFRPLVDSIWHLNAQQAVLEEIIESLSDGLPAPSSEVMMAIIEDVQNGKSTSFRDAVQRRYKPVLSKALLAKKQAEKKRPETPRAEAAPVRKMREGMSMLEIADMLGMK